MEAAASPAAENERFLQKRVAQNEIRVDDRNHRFLCRDKESLNSSSPVIETLDDISLRQSHVRNGGPIFLQQRQRSREKQFREVDFHALHSRSQAVDNFSTEYPESGPAISLDHLPGVIWSRECFSGIPSREGRGCTVTGFATSCPIGSAFRSALKSLEFVAC